MKISIISAINSHLDAIATFVDAMATLVGFCVSSHLTNKQIRADHKTNNDKEFRDDVAHCLKYLEKINFYIYEIPGIYQSYIYKLNKGFIQVDDETFDTQFINHVVKIYNTIDSNLWDAKILVMSMSINNSVRNKCIKHYINPMLNDMGLIHGIVSMICKDRVNLICNDGISSNKSNEYLNYKKEVCRCIKKLKKYASSVDYKNKKIINSMQSMINSLH